MAQTHRRGMVGGTTITPTHPHSIHSSQHRSTHRPSCSHPPPQVLRVPPAICPLRCSRGSPTTSLWMCGRVESSSTSYWSGTHHSGTRPKRSCTLRSRWPDMMCVCVCGGGGGGGTCVCTMLKYSIHSSHYTMVGFLTSEAFGVFSHLCWM